MKDAMYIILHTGCLWFDMCKKSSAGRFFLPHFLLMQLLFLLFVLFQDFLHDFLCHKPILHF